MPQYPVPQFIESEGKIVSFLTYRQFWFLTGGGAIIFAFFFFTPFLVFLIGSLFTAFIVVTIAFFKVNNQSLVTVLLQALGFYFGTKNYTWKKNTAMYPLNVAAKPELKALPEKPAMRLQARPSKLKSIQQMVETKK